MGRKKWRTPAGIEFELSFDVCNQSEFNCKSGKCISISMHCNLINDCDDESDEENCTLISLHLDYNQEIPAIGLENNQSALVVYIDYLFLMIDDIFESSSLMYLHFGIGCTWKDYRIKVRNLKQKENHLDEKDKSKIWLPRFIIQRVNKDGYENEKGLEMVIVRNLTDGKPSDNLQLVAQIEYEGKDVEILFKQWYKTTLVCLNDYLSYFPFDEYNCEMKISLSAYSENVGFKFDATLDYTSTIIGNTNIYKIEKELDDNGNIVIRKDIQIKPHNQFLFKYINK